MSNHSDIGNRDIGNWRKSSRSNGGGGSCVEVGGNTATIGVRDTKDRAGGTLRFDPSAWDAFLSGVKSGDIRR